MIIKVKRTRGDLKFILSKEDPAQVTKIIDLHIEDFLRKLNHQAISDRLKLFKIEFPIGFGQEKGSVTGMCWFNQHKDNRPQVMLDVYGDHLWSILVNGNCGSLTVEKMENNEISYSSQSSSSSISQVRIFALNENPI